MFKALASAFDTCKSSDSRGGLFPTAYDPTKLPLPKSAFWLLLSLLLLASAFMVDAPVAKLMTLDSSTFLSHLANLASKAGEGWVVALAGAVCSLCLFWRSRFNASRGVFLVALTGLLTGAAATVLRSLTGRTRPGSEELQGFYGIWHDSHWIIGKYEFGAFPSGHAATVIGLAAAAWLIDRRFGAVTAIYALLVSWSRLAMGCHHFSDEVASAILGIYGAHFILSRLGPGIYCVGESLQKAWQARKRTVVSPTTSGSV